MYRVLAPHSRVYYIKDDEFHSMFDERVGSTCVANYAFASSSDETGFIVRGLTPEGVLDAALLGCDDYVKVEMAKTIYYIRFIYLGQCSNSPLKHLSDVILSPDGCVWKNRYSNEEIIDKYIEAVNAE